MENVTQEKRLGPVRREELGTGCSALLLALWALALASSPAAKAQGPYESPPEFSAPKILPPDTAKGPHHRVDDRVLNDGFMNHFNIRSDFGALKADSNAELAQRVQEINAIAAMKKLHGSSEFTDAVAETGQDTLEAAKSLANDPAGTLSGAAYGVSRLFQRANDSLFGDPASDYEDDRLKSLVGFSKTKREYAAEFGVDPYSSNPLLQHALEQVAASGYAGGITAGAAMAMIPGGAGIAVSVTTSTDLILDVLHTTPPTDLRRMNRQKLLAMGVKPDVVDLFMKNTVFSPTYQTLLVAALDAMKSTDDRGEFVKYAVLTDTDNVARFRQRQARMYAGYHDKVAAIARFASLGEMPVAITTTGALVLATPVDYLAWTEHLAQIAEGLKQQTDALPETRQKQLWISGKASPRAQQALQSMGVELHQDTEQRLLATGK